MQVCRYASMQVCIHAGIQVCMYAGMGVCRYTGIQLCRYAVCRYAGFFKFENMILEVCEDANSFEKLVYIYCSLSQNRL